MSNTQLQAVALAVVMSCAVMGGGCGDDRCTYSGSDDTAPSCGFLQGHECGGESCCTAALVEGGTFMMGRSDSGSDAFAGATAQNDDEQDSQGEPEHEVTVDSFYLDKYEVTVGRFRHFVESGRWVPADGTGSVHGNEDTAWPGDWGFLVQYSIPESIADWDDALLCSNAYETWTVDRQGWNENLPINCVSWFMAQAFCIAEGGRLPTAAEWEYAAAGGSDNRLYPWGDADPDCTRASMEGCQGDILEVGTLPAGAGRWGHLDLAGNLSEWTFDNWDRDWYEAPEASGVNAVCTAGGEVRTDRGGAFFGTDNTLRAANRHKAYMRNNGFGYAGFRCAYELE